MDVKFVRPWLAQGVGPIRQSMYAFWLLCFYNPCTMLFVQEMLFPVARVISIKWRGVSHQESSTMAAT